MRVDSIGALNSRTQTLTAPRSRTVGHAVPFVILGTTTSTTAVTLVRPDFGFRITSGYIVANDATGSNITLASGGNTVGVAAKGVTDNAVTELAIDDAQQNVAADDALTIVSSGLGNARVVLFCVRL